MPTSNAEVVQREPAPGERDANPHGPAWYDAPAAHWGLALAFALVLGSGLLSCLTCLGIGDWDAFTAHALVSRIAVLEHGQLPTWNPYHCGGMSIPGNFQSRTYTPSFLLVLGFGPLLGIRLWVIVLLGIGFEGARRLATALGAGPWGARFAALAIAGNGHVVMHMAVGHIALLVYLLTPWVLLAVQRGMAEPRRGVVHGALWTGLGLCEGGFYPMVYAWLLAGLFAVAEALRLRTARPLAVGAGASLGGALLAAVVVLPSGLYLASLGTQVPGTEHVPPLALGQMLFGLDQSIDARARFPGQLYWWHEYGTYVGPLFFVLAAAGALGSGRASRLWLALGTFLALASLGAHGLFSPWTWLHQLPVLSSMRVPSRLLGLAVLCFALAGSLRLDRAPRLAAAGVVLFALNLLVVLTPVGYRAFRVPTDLDVPREPFRQHAALGHLETLTTEHRTGMTLDVLRNRGDLDCYDPVRPDVHALPTPPGRGEVELLGTAPSAAASARIVAFSPSALTVELTGLDADAVLVVNQNYAAGWQRDDGAEVRSASGRIGTVVTADDPRVTLAYRPLPFYAGCVLSLLTLLGLLRLGRKRDQASAAPH